MLKDEIGMTTAKALGRRVGRGGLRVADWILISLTVLTCIVILNVASAE